MCGSIAVGVGADADADADAVNAGDIARRLRCRLLLKPDVERLSTSLV